MDGKYDFIQPNQTVVDLGAAPGGWSAYAANKGAYVLAIDLLELSDKVSRLSNVEFIQGDFTELYHQVEEFLQERKVAVVLSDMAPNFIGDSRTDAIRAADLCEQALEFSLQVLKPGGVFVGKLFSGPEESELKEVARKEFKKVTTLKPPASRRESAEKYLFAQGRRENPDS
jgi:23S rRNA (uridine2552-2'-O)-methyltransferase